MLLYHYILAVCDKYKNKLRNYCKILYKRVQLKSCMVEHLFFVTFSKMRYFFCIENTEKENCERISNIIVYKTGISINKLCKYAKNSDDKRNKMTSSVYCAFKLV